MKRISQQINYTSLQTTKNLINDEEIVKRGNKRHQSTVLFNAPIKMMNNNDEISIIFKKNQFFTSAIVVNKVLNDVINDLSKDIQRIEIKKILQSAIITTNIMTNELNYMQDPQKTLNQKSLPAEKQPLTNSTDPISGFIKQNFVKRELQSIRKHKNSASSHENSIIYQQQTLNNTQMTQSQKKLPPLMKRLSQQKMNQTQFISLQEVPSVRKDSKKASHDMEEMVRERFLKDIENRKLKDKIESLSRNNTRIQSGEILNELKRGSKSGYEVYAGGDRVNGNKEDWNFDYDGNKIQVTAQLKSKSNVKILKPLCKVQKQRPEDNKQSKLNKKYHEKMSFVPRGSRNYLEVNSKTIPDFGEPNYTLALKEKVEAQMRKADMKFVEKEFLIKEKLSVNNDQQEQNKVSASGNRRDE